jgi:hypothetical protein
MLVARPFPLSSGTGLENPPKSSKLSSITSRLAAADLVLPCVLDTVPLDMVALLAVVEADPSLSRLVGTIRGAILVAMVGRGGEGRVSGRSSSVRSIIL